MINLSYQELPITINTKVITNSNINKIISFDIKNKTAKIKINQIPQNDKANEALIKFIKENLPIKCKIEIIQGKHSSNKIIKIYQHK